MPGRHLSNAEERLQRLWDRPIENIDRPQLRSIEISGGSGLRGLDGVVVPFQYPITAICGKNGCGKSTILALAALAYHSPQNWHVHWTNTRYRGSIATEDRSYYIFPDFFLYGPNEQIPNGVKITWRHFINGAESSVEFVKSEKRWGRYGIRPEREVDYAPLSRILPAVEVNSVRGAFSRNNPQVNRVQFDDEYRDYFSYIMGANYLDAEIVKTERLIFAECQTDVQYSAFNMGGGEGCVAQLLHLLAGLPQYGLFIVEEIESCLHPEAQVRLAEVIVNICIQKRLQIICSTHSEFFLDALPRQARLLIRKNDGENSIIESPSTRFAIYEMKGMVQPELTIYCEDRSAAVLIEETLTYDQRLRTKIVDVGSDVTVIRQGVSHCRGEFPGECLCVPDGDTTQTQIDNWLRAEANGNQDISPAVEILPGNGLPPERWVLDQLALEDYRNEFADQLGCSRTTAADHVTAMSVELDHHDITFTLSNRSGLSRTECIRRIMKSVGAHPQLNDLRTRIDAILN